MSIRSNVASLLVLAMVAAMSVPLSPCSEARAEPNAALAATLAAQILLTPVCNDTFCEDADRQCKQCARPVTTGAEPKASDALAVLRAAVGQTPCARCICDVDGSRSIVATDALLTLKRAVGQSVALACLPE